MGHTFLCKTYDYSFKSKVDRMIFTQFENHDEKNKKKFVIVLCAIKGAFQELVPIKKINHLFQPPLTPFNLKMSQLHRKMSNKCKNVHLKKLG